MHGRCILSYSVIEAVLRGVRVPCSSMSDDAKQRLRNALGVSQPIRLAVSSEGQPQPDYLDIDSPFALIGRGTGCDIVLPQKHVSFRHAYLQAFANRVLCVDLLSSSGIEWDGPANDGWLTPADRVTVGDTRVQLLDDDWTPALPTWPSPLDSKTRGRNTEMYGELPNVHLELSNRKLQGMSWPINRVLTLLGRDSRCRITCGDDRISRVHCSLLLTPEGLWVIDLLGRGGITVNGETLSVALLEDGDELGVGQYRMTAVYEANADEDSDNDYVEPVAVASSAMHNSPPDTSEFPVTALEVAATARTTSATASVPAPEFLTRNNRIFPVEFVGETVIVSPRGGIRSAPYQQMQLEANIITQILSTRPAMKNVIVDVGATDAMDSIVISCVSSICRSARRKAAICHCSDAMLEVLNDMSLTKVWPYFETRAAAIAYVQS